MATAKRGSWGRRWLVVLLLLALVGAGAAILILPRIHGRAKFYYNQGVLNMRSGDTQAALKSFQTALAKDPTLREAQVEIVRAQTKRKEFALAEQELTKLDGMRYPEADTALLRASLLSARAEYALAVGQAAITADLCKKVIAEDLDPAIELVRDNADKAAEPAGAFARLGDLLMLKAQVRAGEGRLHWVQANRAMSVGNTKTATDEGKEMTQILSARAQSQNDAMTAYGRATELDPKLIEPRLAVAQFEIDSYEPQPERARAVLEPIIAGTPDHRDARLMLATVERLEGRYDKALEDVAAARGKGQDDFGLLVAKGQILDDAGRWDDLLPVSARLVQLKPSDVWAAYLRGRALLGSNQPDPAKRKDAVQEAATSLAVVFQQTPNWPPALLAQARLALAQAMVELGNKEQARSAYKHTIDDTKAGPALNTEQALQIARAAYEANMALYVDLKDDNPAAAEEYAKGYREAQVGILEAQIARKDFGDAEKELAKAAGMGYPEADTALLRAGLLSARAEYALAVGPAALTVDLCAKVITEDLDPAIALAQQNADKAAKPAGAFVLLGGLLRQKSQVQSFEWQLHRAQRDGAKSAESADEATREDKEAAQASSAMRQSRRDAMAAYERATGLDPKLTGPRLVVAQLAVSPEGPQPERARAVLEPIIAQTPDDRSARLMLATVERLEGHYDKALENVAAAYTIGQDDFELLLAKGQILHGAGRWDELLPVSARLVQLKPSDVWAAYLRGRALLESKQPDPAKRREAVQEAIKNLQAIPQKIVWPEARLALAQALAEMGDQEAARTAYKQTLDDIRASQVLNIEQSRQFAQVGYVANMALYQSSKDESPAVAEGYAIGAFQSRPELDEAYKAARAAMAAAKEAPDAQEDVALGHAAAIRMTGDVDGALAVCDAALADPPAPLWGQKLSLYRARWLVAKGSYLDAVKAYEGIRAKWNDKNAARELALLHMRLGQTAEALAVYQDIVRSFPTDQDAMVDLLGLLVHTGKQDEARAALANAEQQFGAETARSLMIGLYRREGQNDQAIALQRSLVQLTPKKASAHVVLAELLWQKGDLAGARAAYDEALTLDATYVPGYIRALVDLQEGRYGQAADLMRQGVKQFPDQPVMTAHLAVAEQAAGNSADAIALFQKALAAEGLSQEQRDVLHWYLAATYAGMGDAAKARTENPALGVSDIAPQGVRQDLLDHLAHLEEPARQKAATALNLLVVFSRAKQPEATVAQIRALQALMPGEPLPACLQASMMDGQGKHQEAVNVYKAVISANPEFAYGRLALVDSLVGAGEEAAAVPVLEEAVAHFAPGQAGLFHFQLGNIREKEGKVDDAVAEYKAAIADPQALLLAANELALLLATERKDPAGALPYAQQAADAAGGRLPNVLDTLGWIQCLNGDTAEAIPLLEKAKAAMGFSPTVRYHLGMAYLKAGRKDEARTELREALAISSPFPEADEASKALGGL